MSDAIKISKVSISEFVVDSEKLKRPAFGSICASRCKILIVLSKNFQKFLFWQIRSLTGVFLWTKKARVYSKHDYFYTFMSAVLVVPGRKISNKNGKSIRAELRVYFITYQLSTQILIIKES